MLAGVPFRSANGSQLILSRCQEDESMCYVMKVEENENSKTAVCSTCLQLSEDSPHGIQKPLGRCKVIDGSVLDVNPWNFHHLHGCRPKKYDDVFSRGENSSGRRSKRLAAAKANVLMDTDNVSGDDAAVDDINDSSDSILEAVAGDEHGSSTYPVIVVQKKTPISYMYRPPGDGNLCYKFYELPHYLVCTTCHRKPVKNKVVYLKFAGCYMLYDPSLNHVPGCLPLLYSEVVKTYQLLQEDESNQQSESGRVSHQDNDMDDSINAPKRIRLSEDDSFMDLRQEIVTDDSMILEESGTHLNNSNLDVQGHRPIPLKVEAGVAKASGRPAHETSVYVSNSVRDNDNDEDNDQIEVPNSVLNRLPSIVLDRGFADSENEAKCSLDDSSRGAMVQPEKSSHHADTPAPGLQTFYDEYKTHTLSFPANGFTQDEMSLEIVGKQIVVKFQRMIASPFSTDCSSRVQHFVKVQFREPVDLGTVEGTVKNNKVYVTASSH